MWIQLQERISHQKWRCLMKKERRKQKRQEFAKERDKKMQEELDVLLNNPEYSQQLLEAEQLHQEAERQEEEIAAQSREEWEARDVALHSMWLREQARKKKLQEEREKQEACIKAEWEKQQQIEAEEEAKKNEANQEKEKEQTELLQKATEGLTQTDVEASHNPEPPQSYNSTVVTTKGEPCPFFCKTGACRFGITCSRLHEYPSSSRSILLTNMYSHFGLSEALLDGLDSDVALEYEDSETYQHFRTFYHDIFPEFKKCGRITQLRVCCNKTAHLRGNVYVQYENEISAAHALTLFNGRWYAGKQLTCMFVNMEKWKPAICGMYWRQLCPKGGQCNFLHTFINPGRMFWKIDPVIDNLHTTNSERSSRRERSARDDEYVCLSYRSQSRDQSRTKRHYSRSRSKSEDRSIRSRSRRKRRHSNSKDRSISPKSKESRKVKQKVRSKHKTSRSQSKSYEYRRSRSRSKSFDYEKSKNSISQKQRRSRSKTKSLKKLKRLKTHKRSRSRSKSPDHIKSRSPSKSYDRQKTRHRSRSHDSKKSNSPSRLCDSKIGTMKCSNGKT